MRFLLPLLFLSAAFFVSAQSPAAKGQGNVPVLDTFLIGKASDKKFSCLLSVLDKINGDSKIETERVDWSKALHEGVQQGVDMNTLLLQYHYLSVEDREDIKKCSLNLGRAEERCKAVYKECSTISYNEATFTVDPMTESEKLPFVTRTCPENYVRYGCCACMRSCVNYPELFNLDGPDQHGYCVKKPAVVSHISDKREEDDMEPVGDKYVARCTAGWARVGSRLCVPKCPLGWQDHGDRCIKTGKINLMPFSWQPGDEELTA
jgi:hypothetical protein